MIDRYLQIKIKYNKDNKQLMVKFKGIMNSELKMRSNKS